MLPELIELNRIRLDDDLSYNRLADEIGVAAGALYRTLQKGAQPHDRTLHKIRRFIAGRKPAKKRRVL